MGTSCSVLFLCVSSWKLRESGEALARQSDSRNNFLSLSLSLGDFESLSDVSRVNLYQLFVSPVSFVVISFRV